jgi:amino acid transporter
MAGTLRRTLRGYFLPRRHTALLVAIVSALTIRPLIGDGQVGPLLFSLAILLLLLIALLTVQVDELVGERQLLVAQRRRRSVVGWVLAVPAIVERLYLLVDPTHRLYTIGSMSWFLFFSFVTWSLLRTLLRHREVTGETISLSISIYLLLGLTWGVLYVVIFQFDPGAFALGASSGPTRGPQFELEVFPTLIYFSLTCLSTIGFGDITPLTLQARYAAVAEGITGQFYLAILVARLVGMQMSRSVDRDGAAGTS